MSFSSKSVVGAPPSSWLARSCAPVASSFVCRPSPSPPVIVAGRVQGPVQDVGRLNLHPAPGRDHAWLGRSARLETQPHGGSQTTVIRRKAPGETGNQIPPP